MTERNLYDGVYYCRECGKPLFFYFILFKNESCVCGSNGFISNIDFDIKELYHRLNEQMDEWSIELS